MLPRVDPAYGWRRGAVRAREGEGVSQALALSFGVIWGAFICFFWGGAGVYAPGWPQGPPNPCTAYARDGKYERQK